MTTNKKPLLGWLLPKNWGIVKVYRDFENFTDWRKVIKREEINPKSKFIEFNLKRTKLFDIYTVVTLDEADIPLPELIKRTKVIESLAPVNRYLDDQLGFAECLDVEFNQFQDDNNDPTLSYLIVYRFRFNKFSIKWLVKFLIKLSIVIFFIIRYDLLVTAFKWVFNLI